MGVFGEIEHYDGTSWTVIQSQEDANAITTKYYRSIWGTSSDNVYAVGGDTMPPADDGGIFHYDGSTWSEIYELEHAYFWDIWGTSTTDIFAVGHLGTIVQYDAGSWTEMDSGTTDWLFGVWFDSPDDVFACGENGTIIHYDGSDWSPMTSGTTVKLRGIWGSSSTDVFVVGFDGPILHNNGSAWSPMDLGGYDAKLYAVSGTSPNNVFANGYGEVLHYDGFPAASDNCPTAFNPEQEDNYPPGGNDIGDACDCEGDFNCDGNIDGFDVGIFLTDFSRSPFNDPCTDEPKCKGDFNCDLNVDAADVTVFLEDFGRSSFFDPCPACTPIEWCSY